MATIIAARLQLQSQAEDAVEQLIHAGFAAEKVTSFYVNTPGQHALYPIGGDRYQSPGIDEIGTEFSEALVEVTETLIGVNVHEDTHEKKPDAASNDKKTRSECVVSDPDSDIPTLRNAGMLVAVELAEPADQEKVTALFRQLGAEKIEKAEGEIVDGEWRDFDPLSEPCYLSLGHE